MITNARTAARPDYLFTPSPERPLRLLAACPAYIPTPLREVPALADAAGVAAVWVKDETGRMGLGSFKALGGAFAVAQTIIDRAGTSDVTSPPAREAAGTMTFITASAGNHGLSVAAGARVFGARAVIVLSADVAESFAERIRALGAEVMRVPGNYEDSVAAATATAEARGYLLLADGSWPGYIDPPAMVMEGYTVLAGECREQLAEGGVWPTHVFLQAGVGGLAAAVAAHIRTTWPVQPQIVVVEPEAAPCLQQSVAAGRLVRAEGPVSNMGRLDCKDASLIAFEALRCDADAFVTVSDAAALDAAGIYRDAGLATTPSGAAPLAALLAPGRAADLGETARVLLVVSEGQ
ncbi:diaminopropionate ammonia-lyase [Acuticoccus sediminis]|uniref:diaminopropionate ammonia-lyase n=1 Tax=Acuticoccus sediminis TaxID=2184697 RepID=UPI001CFEB524|nr:diaminopropionate ammonia-lyase [Acuticoccus sediminis]